MKDEKTIYDCKVGSIINCADAFEQSASQGRPESSPQACADQIRSRCGELQIDTGELQAGADALAAMEIEYFRSVATILRGST